MGHKNIGIVTGWVCRHLLRIRDDDFSLYSIDYWAMHGADAAVQFLLWNYDISIL